MPGSVHQAVQHCFGGHRWRFVLEPSRQQAVQHCCSHILVPSYNCSHLLVPSSSLVLISIPINCINGITFAVAGSATYNSALQSIMFNVIPIITRASRELRHWFRTAMAPQYATFFTLRGALLLRHGPRRGPLPGGHVAGERGEEEHSFEANLHFVHLRLLQQLHGVYHEGCRLSSTAVLKYRRYQH